MSEHAGIFITFEGGEGVGKSTQIQLLACALRDRGREVLCVREPGSSRVSEAIRALLLNTAHTELSPRAELLLYEAARAQLTDEVIAPALDAGSVVLCDRYYDSTGAYQGIARGLGLEHIDRLNHIASNGLVPDATLLLDIDAAVGLRRAAQAGNPDRLERESLAFHEKVRAGFLQLAQREPQRIQVIDATRPPAEIAATIRESLNALFPGLQHPVPQSISSSNLVGTFSQQEKVALPRCPQTGTDSQ